MAILRNIGNSMGILIPKSLIRQAGLDNGIELSLEIRDDGLLIKPIKKARANWKNAIEQTLKTYPHDIDDDWLNSDLAGSNDE